ncbi:MAG: methylcobamide--CoM methyltransferase [Dehalococcoidia bacterium]
MITTVTGSYPKVPNRPRPARLRNALNKADRGELSAEDVAKVRDEVTIEVINEQIEAGLDQITDGHIRWDDELTYFARALSGVTLNGLFRYFDTNTYYRQPVINGAVGWQAPVTVADYEFAAANSSRPVKVALPGPFSLAALSIDEHYAGRSGDLVMDLARAVNAEARALAAAGAPVIQLNEPVLTRRKEDVSLASRAIAAAFEGVNTRKQVNFYYGDVDGILGALGDLPVDVLGLDFVMGPANYDAIKAVSVNKTISAGIFDARNTRLETDEQMAESLRRIRDIHADDRLEVSPNMGLEFLPRERAQEKLQRMVAAARRLEEVPA